MKIHFKASAVPSAPPYIQNNEKSYEKAEGGMLKQLIVPCN